MAVSSPRRSGISRSPSQSQPSYVSNPPVEAVVFAWGAGEDGQLGLDSRDDVPCPKVVESLLGTRFAGRDERRIPLLAGSRDSVAIDADGQVLAWGWNGRGTLGRGHRTGGDASHPQHVLGLESVRIVQVALGGWHCLALDDQGQVYAWGGNEYGQCGLDLGLKNVVRATPCMTGMRFKRIAAGGMHSLGLNECGEIWMWGEAWGDFSMTVSRQPRRIDSRHDYADIASGAFHALAITAQGSVYTWGINDFGQLGNGTTDYATSPELVVGLEGIPIAAVAAGGWHSMAVSVDGDVYVWGRGEYGRLGLGDRAGASRLKPCRVLGALEGHRVVQGSCGGSHSAVVTDDGRCFIWGRAAFGRLGTGQDRDLLGPAELPLPGGAGRWQVVAVSAGGRHSLALAVPAGRARGAGASAAPSEIWTTTSEADDEATDEAVSPDGASIDEEETGAEPPQVLGSPEDEEQINGSEGHLDDGIETEESGPTELSDE